LPATLRHLAIPITLNQCRLGQQVCIPITGNRAKRVLHGALNVSTGALVWLITDHWDHETHPYFLTMVRSHWRGWPIGLFEDRGVPHTAEERLEVAAAWHIETRFLPVATQN